MLNNVPKIFKNFYFVASVIFLIWMLFIDNNDLISQLSLYQKHAELEDQKEYYEEKIKEVEVDREGLLTDSELIEKFARERYLMKKKDEDLFIIIEED